MKIPAVFSQIKKRHGAHRAARRELINRSNDALSKSKRAIFALHRDDPKGAEALMAQADKLFKQIESKFSRLPELEGEGAYRAALEEYAEARLFAGYLMNGKIIKLEPRLMAPTVYVAGLSDATGEIVRFAVRQVTQGNMKEVARAHEVVAMTIEFMLDLDLTGYLRNKFDQAKKNFRRLEEMSYDLAIREK